MDTTLRYNYNIKQENNIMRLFIAIELEPNIKNALLEIQGNMKKAGVTGNYTSIDNTHITLAFIGDYPDPDYVLQAMENVSFKPFNISLKGLGNFGDLWWHSAIICPMQRFHMIGRSFLRTLHLFVKLYVVRECQEYQYLISP